MKKIPWNKGKKGLQVSPRKGVFTVTPEERKQKDKIWRQKNKKTLAEKNKKWRLENRKDLLADKKQYYQTNRESRLAIQKRYYQENKDTLITYQKQYRPKHKEERNVWARDYMKEQRKTNPQFRLASNLRSRLLHAVKSNSKAGSAVRDLGCSIAELKFYLEGKFQDGMSWENWSFRGWHIDHDIPLSFFDLTNREQFLSAVHYTNLQPMWAKDNLTKNKRYVV